MSSGIWIAASGAASQLTALDVAANNTANASTTSYKAESAIFREHLVDAALSGNSATEMRYNGVSEVASDFSAGAIKVTGRPLDVAIRGEGFFAVQGAGGERYTRAGDFQVTQTGFLATADGTLLLNSARRPIQVGTGAGNVSIDAGGTVSAGGEPVGQLRLVRFANQRSLEKEGHSQFRATQGSGAARVAPLQLEAGAVETSNVSIVKGMTEIVSTTRTFDALESVIDTFRNIEQRAANDLMRRR